VRKLAIIALAAAACHRGPPPGTSLTGAPSPREAAVQFLNAARAQDLQAMGSYWGNERGPARDFLDRSELDKRLIIMQMCYDHERFEILDEREGSQGERLVRIQLFRGNRSKTPTFKVIRGPSNRWYVLDADYASMGDFCR
jgi:hypothetical protein